MPGGHCRFAKPLPRWLKDSASWQWLPEFFLGVAPGEWIQGSLMGNEIVVDYGLSRNVVASVEFGYFQQCGYPGSIENILQFIIIG